MWSLYQRLPYLIRGSQKTFCDLFIFQILFKAVAFFGSKSKLSNNFAVKHHKVHAVNIKENKQTNKKKPRSLVSQYRIQDFLQEEILWKPCT